MAYRALLKPTADATAFLSSTVIHPVYFPYPLVLVLHAVRISHAYSTKVKAAGHKLPPVQHLAGYLIFSWGSALLTHALLCLPAPQLYSIAPWICYVTVHVILTSIFSIFPWPSGRLVDTLFPLIDAIGRSGAIVGSLALVHTHPAPAIRSSWLAEIIIGAIASAGGGALAGTLGVWDKEWSFKTPAFLKGGIIPTMDVWAGAFAAVIYGAATLSNPIYEPVNTYLVGKPKAFMTPIGARMLVVVFLTSMYIIRTFYTHYLPASSKTIKRQVPAQKRAIKPVGKEKKSQ